MCAMRRHARHPLALVCALCSLGLVVACGDRPPAVRTTSDRGDTAVTAATAPPPVAPIASASAPTVDVDAPRPLKLDPPNGATDVDPARTTIAVTYDRPMDRDGWAYVVESPATAPDIGESAWDFGATINTAQVKLQPGRSYVVWLNSATYAYFRDLQGRTAVPVRWTFSTAPASPARSVPTDVGTVSAHAPRAAATPPAPASPGR
jgi:hypothetical protein